MTRIRDKCDSWASEGWSLELWEGGMSQSGQTFIQGAHITHPQSPFHSETISSHIVLRFRAKINLFATSYGFYGFFLVSFVLTIQDIPCET